MEILKNFGFEPKLFAAQIVNFLIILIILRKLLFKPIVGMIKKREDSIKEGLEKAEESQKLYEKTVEKEKEVLRNAQDQSKKITEDAKKQAMDIMHQAEEAAKKQTDKIIVQAREQIVQETKSAEARLTAHVSELAVNLLNKSVKDLFSQKDQKELMTKAVKKIKA